MSKEIEAEKDINGMKRTYTTIHLRQSNMENKQGTIGQQTWIWNIWLPICASLHLNFLIFQTMYPLFLFTSHGWETLLNDKELERCRTLLSCLRWTGQALGMAWSLVICPTINYIQSWGNCKRKDVAGNTNLPPSSASPKLWPSVFDHFPSQAQPYSFVPFWWLQGHSSLKQTASLEGLCQTNSHGLSSFDSGVNLLCFALKECQDFQ